MRGFKGKWPMNNRRGLDPARKKRVKRRRRQLNIQFHLIYQKWWKGFEGQTETATAKYI